MTYPQKNLVKYQSQKVSLKPASPPVFLCMNELLCLAEPKTGEQKLYYAVLERAFIDAENGDQDALDYIDSPTFYLHTTAAGIHKRIAKWFIVNYFRNSL